MRMRKAGRNLVTLVMVLLLVLTAACAPAPKEITPAPTPTPEPTPTPAPTPTPTPTPALLPEGMGMLEVRVTDPPKPEFSSIEVFIDTIEVHRVVPGESGEWIPVSPLAVTSFDLVTLVGVEEFLGSVVVEAGKFTQIRVHIDTVVVTPEGGTPEPATLPSGILKIVRPFEIQEGLLTVLTLDFDGERSVVTTGRGKFIFKPVVRLSKQMGSPPATGGDTTPPTITATGVVEDTTAPVLTLTGVIEGQVIVSPNTVTPVFSASDDIDSNPIVVATLNGDEFTSGAEVSEVGEYELVVTAIDASGNEAEVAVNFEIVQE